MVVRLEIPMLSVNAQKMSEVDPRNAGNLYGMWSGGFRLPSTMIWVLIVSSLLKMCRHSGRWPKVRKSELANMGTRNTLL